MARIVCGENARLICHGAVTKCLTSRLIFIFSPFSRSAAAAKTTAATAKPPTASTRPATAAAGPPPATVTAKEGKDENEQTGDKGHHQRGEQ